MSVIACQNFGMTSPTFSQFQSSSSSSSSFVLSSQPFPTLPLPSCLVAAADSSRSHTTPQHTSKSSDNRIEELEKILAPSIPNLRRRDSFANVLNGLVDGLFSLRSSRRSSLTSCSTGVDDMHSSLTSEATPSNPEVFVRTIDDKNPLTPTTPSQEELSRAERMLQDDIDAMETSNTCATSPIAPKKYKTKLAKTKTKARKKYSKRAKRSPSRSSHPPSPSPKIKLEQSCAELFRHNTPVVTSTSRSGQTLSPSPSPSPSSSPLSTDPITAFLPSGKAYLLSEEHKPARGRGRPAQLSNMTQEQIEAEADARVEKSRQAARKSRARRKQQVDELHSLVESLKNNDTISRQRIQQLKQERENAQALVQSMQAQIESLQAQLRAKCSEQ